MQKKKKKLRQNHLKVQQKTSREALMGRPFSFQDEANI